MEDALRGAFAKVGEETPAPNGYEGTTRVDAAVVSQDIKKDEMPSTSPGDLPSVADKNTPGTSPRPTAHEPQNQEPSPRVVELLTKIEQMGKEGMIPTLPLPKLKESQKKIKELLTDQGFIPKKSGYVSGDGSFVSEETISFLLHLGDKERQVLSEAKESINTTAAVKRLLEMLGPGSPKGFVEEIFKRVGAKTEIREDKEVYILSDGEISRREAFDFMRMSQQSRGIRSWNEAREKERSQERRLREDAENWWKKYE